ncbi:MAG: CRISPR-associated endonuclease Cas3'' [Thermoguttaceae bacterium]|jgi:CRISPR-associated endonuclease/helicase Cas3
MRDQSQAVEYYARTSEDGAHKQLLRQHLQNVAGLARGFARESCPGNVPLAETAYLAGLLHDLGKYREEFQGYLLRKREKGKDTAHSVYGAAAGNDGFDSPAIAFAIAGHHAGLHNVGRLASLVKGTKFNAQERFPILMKLAENPQELGVFPPANVLDLDANDDLEKRRYEFSTRMLFSMLVDADRLDSERFEQEFRRGRRWQRQTVALHAEMLLDQLQKARRKKAVDRPSNELNRLRNAIFDACVQAGKNLPQGFFSLTVPTGGAKTLSAMACGLAHASRRNLRRIFVVIPYLSIIEQNAREYRSIFGADHVLEHHSAVEIPREVTTSEKDATDEFPHTSLAELAMENWDMPIIVTTTVQFIETLFAALPSRARRLHNVARSVVIFDEVQTLPTHLLEPTLDVLRELKNNYGVTFVFCSATQPGFRKSPSLSHGFQDAEVEEIAPAPREIYRNLRRVNYNIRPRSDLWDWQRLADEMARKTQSLCVLNLRRQAFAAYEAVQRQAVVAWRAVQQTLMEHARENDSSDAVFHLSSAMCPAHRLDLLGLSPNPPVRNVKARLKSGKPCWVISTQLIEAGVDVDFPVVFRAAGPLDSIVQSGGRCNREGSLLDNAGRAVLGQVTVFYPADGGLPCGIYEKATNKDSSKSEP